MVYTFDMAVSHLCLTRTGRENCKEEATMGGENEALKGADGGAIGRKGADTEVGWCVCGGVHCWV